MPDLAMWETEAVADMVEPMEAVEVTGEWDIDAFDNDALESLLETMDMPIYNVTIEASSSGIDEMTMVLPTFVLSIDVDGEPSDDGVFLTPTLSDLPAGMQVMIPIDIANSLDGSNLDLLGNMTVSYTPAVSASNVTMMISVLDNNPEQDISDGSPGDISAFYIDVSYVGDFVGSTPSDEAFFAEPPQITFTVTEEWAEDENVDRDANDVPIITLFLLDEATGEWIKILDEDIEAPESVVGGDYTYTATLPHLSTFAVNAEAESVHRGGGVGPDHHTRSLTESLLVSSVANLGVPFGSEGRVVFKDISESLTLTAIQLQPLHQRVITIDDVLVAVSIGDVKSATFGTAVATLNFEIKNRGDGAKEMVLKYGYSDPLSGWTVYRGEETVIVGPGESIIKVVEIPFHSSGSYSIMIEVESESGTLTTTEIAVEVPWFSVYLYILIAIAVGIVLISAIYVIIAMHASKSIISKVKVSVDISKVYVIRAIRASKSFIKRRDE
jgi:hypothetical protein